VPDAHIVKATAKIYDLQDPTAKMSKSAASPNGIIELLDRPKTVAKRIKSAMTDNLGVVAFDPEQQPGVANLLTIFSALTGRDVDQIVGDYAGKGYGHLKVDLAEVVVDFLTPFQERVQGYLSEPDTLDAVLEDGAERARTIARGTLERVNDRFGLLPRRRTA
jgi:tryptophanyl-tRNA synthetase